MNRKGYVCFYNSSVEVEIVATPEDRAIGLMNRSYLPEGSGMLFVYDNEDIHKFWMKNMIIALDLIWLDGRGTIIHIEKNVMPCDGYCQPFGPELYSKYVLEINEGYADTYNINVGDNVRVIL